MSLSPETMLELMALADGELEGDARAQAERLVASSAEARRVVETMRAPALGEWLADAMEPRLAAADGIAGAVMARLERSEDGASAGVGGVVRLADARARRSSGVTRGQLGVVAGILVLAATILFYVRSDHEATDDASPVASVEPPVAPPVAATTAEVPAIPTQASALAQQVPHAAQQGVEVDEIDSPAHDVTVFEIPVAGMAAAATGSSPSSVVIMIEDEPVKP